MPTCTITGPVNNINNAPFANKYIYFRLKQVGTDSGSTSVIAQDRDSVLTDASGQFSIDIWDNGNSGTTSILQITIDGSEPIDVIIPADTAAIQLWDLFENYKVGTADAQLPTNDLLYMRKAANLSDLGDLATAQSNLQLDTAAYTPTTDYATAAQGALADSSLQDSDIGLNVQAYAGVLSATTASYTSAEKSKLSGVETGAQVTNESNIVAAGGYVAGGTDVAIVDGGTGASTAEDARTNLGVFGDGDTQEFVQLEVAPAAKVYTEGRLHWDEDESTVGIDTGIDDVTIQVGQENVIRVRNSTGSTIINGSVVRISGSTGNRPNIILAQADTFANAAGTIGMTTHDIENNTDGFVTTYGLVRDLVTSSFSEGDIVYLSSTIPGALTNVEPAIQIQIGFVTTSHVTSGTALVAVESHIPVYGSIYVDAGATAQTITQGATYTKSTAFTTDGNDSGGISDVANDQLVLTRGAWHIAAAVSFYTDTNSNNVFGALFLDGSEAANLHFQRKVGTGSDVGSASITGIVVVDQDTETIDLRLRHDVVGDEDITITYANLNGHKISN